MNRIEVKGISKSFGSVKALDNVSLAFEEEKIYGLLGRNGAGKSTLLSIITNRIFADGGTVTVDGENAAENDRAQSKIFLMSEKTLYPEGMKVRDIFKWSAEFYPGFDREYALRAADLFGLETKKPVRSLSTGYNSIFKNVVALSVGTPYVLFDEPVLGLDANHRELFYRLLIERYSEKPFMALLSTHLIEEVSRVIEEVVIIKNGSIIRTESRDALLSKGYTVAGNAAAIDSYIKDKSVIGTDSLGGLKTAYIMGSLDKSALPAGVEASVLDLQKLFIKLTGD